MQSFTVDEGKRMRELLDVLRTDDSDGNVEAKETAFEELTILIETIDNSRGEWLWTEEEEEEGG